MYMYTKLAVIFFLCCVSIVPKAVFAERAQANKAKVRCGWFDNPTPQNVWLHDRDGEWTIGIQGGYQAEGEWPDFTDAQWVETNGLHGHGCACLKVLDNPQDMSIVRILSAHAIPLGKCRQDPAIKNKEPQ